jgi:hypothetical protein
LLANTVGQPRRCHRLVFLAGKRAPTVDPGNLRNLRQTGFDDSSASSKSRRLQLNRLAPRKRVREGAAVDQFKLASQRHAVGDS